MTLGQMLHGSFLQLIHAQNLFLGQELAVEVVVLFAEVQDLAAVCETVLQHLLGFFFRQVLASFFRTGSSQCPDFLLELAERFYKALTGLVVQGYFLGDVLGLNLGHLGPVQPLFAGSMVGTVATLEIVLCECRATESSQHEGC